MAECLDVEDIPIADDHNAQATVPCDDCEGTEDVFSYCLDCPGALCEMCKEGHQRRKMTRSHKIVRYDDPEVERAKDIASLGKCDKHASNSIVAYCERCEKLCCSHCVATEHKNHETTDILDKIHDAKLEVGEYIEAQKVTIESLTNDIAETKDEIEKEISKAKESEDKVDAVLKMIHAMIDQEGEKLRDEITNHKKKNISNLKKHITKSEEQMAQCEKILGDSDEGVNSNIKALLEFNKQKPMLIRHDTVSKQQPSLSIEQSSIDVESISQMIGKIRIESPTPMNDYSTSSDFYPNQDLHVVSDDSLRSKKRLGQKVGSIAYYTLSIKHGQGPVVLRSGKTYFRGWVYTKEEWEIVRKDLNFPTNGTDIK